MAITAVDQGGAVWLHNSLVDISGNPTSLSKAYATALTPGSLLVAVLMGSHDGSTPITVGGQTMTRVDGAATTEPGLGQYISVHYLANNPLSTAATANTTTTGASRYGMFIGEFLGCSTSTPLEGAAEANVGGAGTDVMAGQTIAIAATALVVAVCQYYPDNASDMVVGTGYTKIDDFATLDGVAMGYPYALQYRLNGSGTQSVAWSRSSGNQDKPYWSGAAAAFKIQGVSVSARGQAFGGRGTAFNGGRTFIGPIY